MSNRFGNFYYRQDVEREGFDIFEFGTENTQPIDWEHTVIEAAGNCQRRYIAVLTRERDTLKRIAEQRESDMAELLHYVQAGQYGSGEDVDLRTESGLSLFNAVRGLMADAIAGDFLADEVKRLDAREQRFKKHLDAMNRLMAKVLTVQNNALHGVILDALEADGGILDISPMAIAGTDWYHYNEEAQVLEMLSKGEITEGGVAYLLDTDIIGVRVKMEQAYGANWRDLAADD